MHTLILLAALSSHITFNTTRDGELYTITPQVLLTEDCLCQVQILAKRRGQSGDSTTQQRKTYHFVANQPTDLMRLTLNIAPRDSVDIQVTVSDGQALHLSQRWTSPEML